MASPAEIVRSCLADRGVVQLPAIAGQDIPYEAIPGDGSVLCYAPSFPDEIDQGVGIFDTSGVLFAYRQRGSKGLKHPGIKVHVRALDQIGFTVAMAIEAGLNSIGLCSTITGDGITHYVQSVYVVGTIIGLGEERGKKRQLWSINARVAFQDRESG